MGDLKKRTEVHGAHRLADVVVLHVRYNSYDFEVGGALNARYAEVSTDRIPTFREEFFDEGVVDHCNRRRCCGVLRCDSASAKHMVSDDIEELRPDAEP